MSTDEPSITDISESLVEDLTADHAACALHTKKTIEDNKTKLGKSFDKRLNPHAPEFVPRAQSLENVHLVNKVTEEGEDNVTTCGRIFDAIWKENPIPSIPSAFMQRHYQTQRMHPYATINHWYGGHYASYLMPNRYYAPPRRGTTPELRRTQSQKLSHNISLNINAPEYVPQMRRSCSSISGECQLLAIDKVNENVPYKTLEEITDVTPDVTPIVTPDVPPVVSPNVTPNEALDMTSESKLPQNEVSLNPLPPETETELLALDKDTKKLSLRCSKRLLKTVPCDDDDDDRGCCCSLM